jgi:hypothetical protein
MHKMTMLHHQKDYFIKNLYVTNSKHLQNPHFCSFRALELKGKVSRSHSKLNVRDNIPNSSCEL